MLANAVIPNEYGIDPSGKLRIGSRICAALMGKILADLGNMREESIATAHVQVPPPNACPRAFAPASASNANSYLVPPPIDAGCRRTRPRLLPKPT